MALTDILIVKKPYNSPVAARSHLFVLPFDEVIQAPKSTDYVKYYIDTKGISFTDNNGKTVNVNILTGQTFDLISGSYAIVYSGVFHVEAQSSNNQQHFNYTYRFQVVQNQYPLPKPTILDVINRVLELVEPLVWDSNKKDYVKPPRFHFAYKYSADTSDGKDERALFNQTAPEFTFTRQTLRETLQQIGQFIHAEPRLIWTRETDGDFPATIIFDRYGEQKLATYQQNGTDIIPLNQHPYKGKRFSYNSGVAFTKIESDVDNFVNRLDKEGGTIAEPYRGGALSLRSETAYTRLEDSEELYFPTSLPIMDITSFVWVDTEGFAGEASARYDITHYIFEKTIYDAELSSYDTQYPRSKSYGLYFSQGSKSVRGFFFKNTEASGGVLTKYSIVNILEQVTQKTLIGVWDLIVPGKDNISKNYPKLCFELVYTPIYSGRVSHGKSYTGDMLKKPFTLMYNQTANVVETRYYGEHLKGVAERLGNVEKTVSIMVRNSNNIPEIGQLWDDDYYISTVTGSVVLDGILLDIGLSKNFNRLSEYVGANSYKRYYEVSERMSQERRTLYKDYLVITQKDNLSGLKTGDCFVNLDALIAVANTFSQSKGANIRYVGSTGGSSTRPIYTDIANSVIVSGFSETFISQTKVLLPVVSSAIGNVMEFTWSYKDNYSAGVKVVNQKEGDVTGYFGAEVTYGDYYGTMYYQTYGISTYKGDVNLDLALELPQLDMELVSSPQYISAGKRIIRKDNREVLSQSYSVEFVTDIKGLVIGSALARNNCMVCGLKEQESADLYILPNRINKFSLEKIDLSNATKIFDYAGTISYMNKTMYLNQENFTNTISLRIKGVQSTVKGKAWAIVTKRYDGEPYRVEGQSEPVTPHYGGELLIGWNGDIEESDVVGQFNIVPTHDIFEFIKKEI